MKSYRLVLISVACAGVFAGCSSGGGDSVPLDQTVSGVQLDGAISKGIVVDGPVTIEELDSAGNAIAVVGAARTGSDGSYQITLGNNYTGGVLQVTITADGNTRMKCDIPLGCGDHPGGPDDLNSNSIIDFGEFYKPSALTMTALLPGAEANAVVNASVTPFTHTAAELAKSQPSLDSATVANANSEVSNLLGGLDILNTAPVDITDAIAVDGALSPTQVIYAALLATVAIEANTDADGQPLLNEALAILASSFASGTILADDGGDLTQISLLDIVNAAETVLAAIGIVDVTGVLVELQQDIDTAVNNIIDPVPSPTVDYATLDKVKAMMSDVRTWGNVIIAEAGAEASTFAAEVGMASDAVGILGTSALDALGAGVDAALLFNGDPDLSSYILDLPTDPNPRQFDSGTIASPSAGVIVITDGVISGYTVNMTVTLPADGTTATDFNLEVTSATVEGRENSLSITDGTVNVSFVTPYTINYVQPIKPLPAIADLVVDLVDASFTQNVDTSDQILASPVTFTGKLNANMDYIRVTNVSDPLDPASLVLPKTLRLEGTLSNTMGDNLTASLAVNVTNTDTFEFFGDFAPVDTLYSANHAEPFASWTYSDTDTTLGDDTFTSSYPGFWANVYWDASTGIATLTMTYNSWFYSYPSHIPLGSLAEALTYFGIGTLGDIYAWVEDEGMYYASTTGADFSTDGTLDGTLADPEFIIENANQWIDADIGLTFGLQLTDLPAASVNINADRTSFGTGNGTIRISYGSRQIEITAAVNAEDFVSTNYFGSVVITNQDGVKVVLDSLVLESNQLSGALLYNAIQYGAIEITPSGYLKVSYIDGTFEIF